MMHFHEARMYLSSPSAMDSRRVAEDRSTSTAWSAHDALLIASSSHSQMIMNTMNSYFSMSCFKGSGVTSFLGIFALKTNSPLIVSVSDVSSVSVIISWHKFLHVALGGPFDLGGPWTCPPSLIGCDAAGHRLTNDASTRRWRGFTTDWFSSHHTVRCAHRSSDVINFIIVACRISSRLKRYKNYKNRVRLAKVIVKNKMSRFYGSVCITVASTWRAKQKQFCSI